MPRTILIVEDSEPVRLSTAWQLQQWGYDVVEAANGIAALSLLHESCRPDLIVLDLVMPQLDAWGFMEQKQKLRDDGLRGVPVLVSSANLEFIAIPPGVNAAIQAPWRPEDFRRQVEALLDLQESAAREEANRGRS